MQMDLSITGKASGSLITRQLGALKAGEMRSNVFTESQFCTAATSRFSEPQLNCSTGQSDVMHSAIGGG